MDDSLRREKHRAGNGDAPTSSAPVHAEQQSLRDLLLLIAHGDRAAFEEFYDQTSARVYGLTVRILRDRALCQDVTQEVFLQVWQQAPHFNPTAGTPLAWLMTIAHRRAVDGVRSQQRSVDREQRFSNRNQTVEHDEVLDTVTSRDEAQSVQNCLGTLTDTQQESVKLAYYSGLTYRQVAERLGAALPTVKSRIRDGLIRLRECLGGS
ncbi:ECF RNA polymerase sigma factor SigK [Saxibacter everestensis]|uniref:ECF RNA polymerase sigma factor SigK n=1 Tax=Saxibacter everestensis TaxID=2909229 RepID=A0ABY8QR11_9MICO|nr:ECF RNA polymerase sigma factor SigK [Brevibacteriaceae bacterium ZFBP1038]